jgi:hypothetical protein
MLMFDLRDRTTSYNIVIIQKLNQLHHGSVNPPERRNILAVACRGCHRDFIGIIHRTKDAA